MLLSLQDWHLLVVFRTWKQEEVAIAADTVVATAEGTIPPPIARLDITVVVMGTIITVRASIVTATMVATTVTTVVDIVVA